MPLEVNLANLVVVLHNVTDVDGLGLQLGVPKCELDKIRQDFHRTEERKRNVLQWWLSHTFNPTWKRVITALKAMDEPVLADGVAVVSKRRSLYEPCEEDSPKWENTDHKKTLDEMLEDVLQRSDQLEKEWQKGENEWREYLGKLKKIEQDWENLVKTQQTRRAYLTLGIGLFFRDDSEPLQQRYSLLEQKVEKHMARSKKLREFYEKATMHEVGLENTEIELKEWENKLLKQASELEKRINQMEKLGGKFLEEANGCRKQLGKLGELLQNCRKSMNECREELTKSHIQLDKCRMKLIECEVNLKSCRDELENNHSQITKCIKGLKKQSEDLSSQIKTLTERIGGLVGASIGAGTGAGAGALIGALIGALGGPIGLVGGTAIGAATGTIGVGATGVVVGRVMANDYEKQLEKQREILRRCESDLNTCGNVVERCKKVLMNSEEELQELKKIVNQLEQAFRKLP